MWIRRTADEIKARNRWSPTRLNPVVPLLWALGGAALLGFIDYIGATKFEPPRTPVPVSEAAYHALPAFGIIFVALYGMQLLNLRLAPAFAVLICARCHKVQGATADGRCACGGELEPFENWKWVKDGEEPAGPPDGDKSQS